MSRSAARRSTAIAILASATAAGTLVGCRNNPTETSPEREPPPVDTRVTHVRVAAPATSIAIGDTARLALLAYDAAGRPVALPAGEPAWVARSDSVVRWNVARGEAGLEPTDGSGLLFANDSGATWVVGSIAGLADSVRVVVAQAPAVTTLHEFRDPESAYGPNRQYSRFSGICWAWTADGYRLQYGRELWWTQLGAFVADARRRGMARGRTTWTLSDSSVIELRQATDSLDDVDYRPAGPGHTTVTATIGDWSGSVDVYVDLEQRCAAIVPASSAVASATGGIVSGAALRVGSPPSPPRRWDLGPWGW